MGKSGGGVVVSGLNILNQLTLIEVKEKLMGCCQCNKWADELAKCRPFIAKELMFQKAEEIWQKLSIEEWHEAFLGHPRIGDVHDLKERFRHTHAEDEQAGMSMASNEELEKFMKLNLIYEEKFGFIFIICATGKSVDDMFKEIIVRTNNEPESEIKIAAEEQNKITKLRLEKLI